MVTNFALGTLGTDQVIAMHNAWRNDAVGHRNHEPRRGTRRNAQGRCVARGLTALLPEGPAQA